MGKLPTSNPVKRVLVLVELEDGAIGAVYSDKPDWDAAVDLRTSNAPRVFPWDESAPRTFPWEDAPRYAVNVGPMLSIVVHEPAFHDPAVESMAQAVMNQWKMGE